MPKMVEMNPQNKDSIILHYDITLACNNRCSYCYCLEDLDNKKLINREVYNNTIDAINNMEAKDIKIDILGGEPLIVHEDLFHFINSTQREKVRHNIISNINFKPSSKRIQELKSFLESNNNVEVTASWHSVSNEEYFKKNVLFLKDHIKVTLLLNDDNVKEVIKQKEWLESNDIWYLIEPIYNIDSSAQFTKYEDEYQELIIGGLPETDIIDGEVQDQMNRSELLTIAQRHNTICQLSTLKIDYNGNISPICSNPYDLGNVKDGIKIKEVFCQKFHCRCTTFSYKRIMK